MSRQSFRKKVKREAQHLLSSLLEPEKPEENTEGHGIWCSDANANENSNRNSDSGNNDLKNNNETEINDVETNDDDCDERNYKQGTYCIEDLRSFLSVWSVKYSISVLAMNELLNQLKVFDNSLPKDVRALRETPRNTTVMAMGRDHTFIMNNRKILTLFTEEFIALKNVVNKSMMNLSRQQTFSSLLQLPLLTVDEVISFDRDIKDDEAKRSKLISKFNNQSYDDVRKFVSENLKILFKDDNIVSQFSWLNASNNIPVKDFTIIKILKDLAVEHTAQSCNSSVEKHIKKFFSLAKDRLNKTIKRKRDP